MQHDAHTLFFKQTTTQILHTATENTAEKKNTAVHFIFMRPTIIKFKAAGDKVNTTINN